MRQVAMATAQRKILVIGAGVIGSVYAGRLALAGHDVTLCARGRRRSELAVHGLRLRAFDRPDVRRAPITVTGPDELGGVFDLAIVSVRYPQLDEALDLLAPVRARQTMVLSNAPGIILDDMIVWGFPGAGGTIEDGVVHYALIPEQPTTLGSATDSMGKLRDLRSILESAGFATTLCGDMAAWLAIHAVFVTALAGGFYRAGGSAAALAASPLLAESMRGIRDGFMAMRRAGVAVLPRKLDLLFCWLPPFAATAYWRRFLSRPVAELVMSRHAMNAPDELAALVGACRGLLAARGVAVPPGIEPLWQAVEAQAARRRPSA